MFQFDLFAATAAPARPTALRAPSALPRRTSPRSGAPLDLPAILERLAQVSERPRFAFMVLNLVADAADEAGRAGPWIRDGGRAIPIRQWLADALAPMAARDPRRIAREQAVRAELAQRGALPADAATASALIAAEMRARTRRTGLTHVSRAVSDLVAAGLLTRHYQGYRVDHHNRGAGRQAVYSLAPAVRAALARRRGAGRQSG